MSAAQSPADLWRPDVETLARRGLQVPRHHDRMRSVRVEGDVLRRQDFPGALVRLALFADAHVVAEATRVTDHPLNGYSWRGRVVGEPDSMVTLVLEGGAVGGTVVYSGGTYEIRYVRPGVSAVLEPSRDVFRPDIERPRPEAAPEERGAPGKLAGDPVLDILGLYSPLAATQIGGKRAIKTAWRVAIANMLTALDNSGVDLMVRLVGVKRMPYSKRGQDAGFFETALDDVTNAGDGQMERAHRLRDRFGADVVALAAEINDSLCGLGWLNGRGSGVLASEETWAFNVDSVDCLSGFGGLTVAHEAGHNLGLRHDRDNDSSGDSFGAYRHSYGFRRPGQFRTLMAYVCEPDGLRSCPQISNYSNPKVRHSGSKTGRGRDNNARSLQRDRTVYTQWRSCRRNC